MHIAINFQVNLDTSNHADSVTLDALLSSLERIKSFKAECEAPVPSQPPAPSQPPVETPAQTASEAPSAPATDVEAATPAKRGRKPKNEVAAAPVEKSPEAASTETEGTQAAASSETADASATAEPELPALSIDEVRAALQQFTAVKGVPAGIELLKEFGAGRISELSFSQYPFFVERCAV